MTKAELIKQIEALPGNIRLGINNGFSGHVNGIASLVLEEHPEGTFLVLHATEDTVACHDDGVPLAAASWFVAL